MSWIHYHNDIRTLFSLALLTMMLGLFPIPQSAHATTEEEMVERWQKIYGPVDFSEEALFSCMVRIGIQPPEALRPFGDKMLAPGYMDESETWMKEFFKEKCRPDIRTMDPKGFYLQKRNEPNYLVYQWQCEDYKLEMTESHGGILLEIRSVDLNPARGIAGKKLAECLFEIFDLDYDDPDQLAGDFDLPDELQIGSVFTNAKLLREVGAIGDEWNEFAVGFIGKDGICVMLFKAVKGRAAAEFPYNPSWLNRRLLEKDGKTPVAEKR